MTNARSNRILAKSILGGNGKYKNKQIQKGGSDCVSLRFTDLTYRTERRGLMKEKLFSLVPFCFHFVKVCWSEARCDVLIASILCCVQPPPVAARQSSSQQWGLYVHKTSSYLRLSDLILFSFHLVFLFYVSPFLLFFITSIFLGSSPLVGSRAHAACLSEFQSYG